MVKAGNDGNWGKPPLPPHTQELTSPFHSQAWLPQLLQAKWHRGNPDRDVSGKTVALPG